MKLPSLTISQKYRMWVSKIFALLMLGLVLFSSHSWARDSLLDTLFESSGLVLIVFCTFGRLWASLYVGGYKNEKVIDLGPYSMVRNPLYFFSFLGTLGLGLVSENILFLGSATLLFLFYYPFVIFSEEEYLLAKFGDDYAAYMRRTPRFIPNPRLLREPEFYEVNVKVFKRHTLDATMFIWFYLLFHFIEKLQQMGVLPVWFRVP